MMRFQLKILKEEPSRLLLILIFISSSVFVLPKIALSQYQYDYEWLFGYNGEGWDNKRFAINLLSFHSNPPDTFRTELFGSTGAAATVSIADSEGELLFYSNGCRLFHSDGTMVEGGEVLLSGPTFDRNCYIDFLQGESYPTWIQSRFILPMDESDSLFFFLFHRWELTHHTDFEEPRGIVAFDLTLGRIKIKDSEYRMISSEVILDQMMANGQMQAVRSAKENHWWVIVPHHVHQNNYEIFHLGPMGVDTIITFNADYTGTVTEDQWMQSGGSAMSPKGDRFVWWLPPFTIGTFIFDFDRSTGELSNMQHLPHPEKDSFELGISSGGGGASISPNGRFLYINTLTHLYQYDLHAEDVESSMVHIAEFDGFQEVFGSLELPTYFFMQQLAPDCRIYMSSPNAVSWLHVINYPNRKGRACDFQQHSFKLPGNHSFGLPYHPNYRLGTDYPVCDSTLTTTSWFVPEESDSGLYLYPNPARDYAVVGWSGMEPVAVSIYDLTGRLLLQDRISPESPDYYLELDHFSPGMYLIRIQDKEGRYMTERLVVDR